MQGIALVGHGRVSGATPGPGQGLSLGGAAAVLDPQPKERGDQAAGSRSVGVFGPGQEGLT